ncbi:hypothetical protein Isolate57596_49390 [Mycobacteroides abscessus subsp. abscessus]
MATGTAITKAKTALSTVTMNRSRMPNRRLFSSVVLNSALVRKLALSARSEGTARISRKIAIRAMADTIVAPAAVARPLNSCSPQRPEPGRIALGGGENVG